MYALSDVFYFFLYHVSGYRKKVVFENLRKSFPEKTDKEIKAIGRKYYKYLCDLFLETFKTLTISKNAMNEHCYLTPKAKALADDFAAKNQSMILVMGHLGNWEWAGNTSSLQMKQQLQVIYRPISNKYFNSLMYKMRTRFGARLITMKDTFSKMLANKEEVNTTVFVSDQAPPPENAYWTTFLNQDTPVFRGTELIARKINYPVVYAHLKRIKRGFYEIDAEVLCENPRSTAEGEISEMHTRKLERDIIAQPEVWLWSHRRWKHKRITKP